MGIAYLFSDVQINYHVGSSDPFVEVKVENQVQKTPVIKYSFILLLSQTNSHFSLRKTLNPFWNKKLSLYVIL